MQLSKNKAIALVEWVYSTENYRLAVFGSGMSEPTLTGKEKLLTFINRDDYDAGGSLQLCFVKANHEWDDVVIYHDDNGYHGVDNGMGGIKTATAATLDALTEQLQLRYSENGDYQPVNVKYRSQSLENEAVEPLTPDGYVFIDAHHDYELMLCRDGRGDHHVFSFCKSFVSNNGGRVEYYMRGLTHHRLCDYPYSQHHPLAVQSRSISKAALDMALEHGQEIISTLKRDRVCVRFTAESAAIMNRHITDIKVGLIDFRVDG